MTVHRKLESLTPLWLLVILAIVALQAWRYFPFMADDAFISLRYADRLLHGHGLTWSNDQVVEGYSNLLLILIVSAMGAIGVDLVLAARIVGIVSMVAVAGAAACLLRGHLSKLPLVVALAMLAVSPPVTVWAIGGLENALFMALSSWAAVLCLQELEGPNASRRLAIGGLLGATCLTRADGFVLAGAIAAGWLAAAPAPLGRRLRHVAVPAMVAAACVVGQTLFRLSYYGDWLPNTYYAKVAFNSERVAQGLMYAWKALAPSALVVVFAAIAARGIDHGGPMRTRRLGFLAVVLGAWIAYVAIIGGDVFPSYRHMLPGLALLALMACEFLRQPHPAPARALRPVMLLSLAGSLGVAGLLQHRDPENQRAKEERWEWEAKHTGEALAALYAGRNVQVALTAAGSVGYYSRLPVLIDMYGLNDRYLTRNRPSDFGHGLIGHEVGDNAYVLSKKPDVIVFHVGDRQPWMGMGQEPAFVGHYTPRPLPADPNTGVVRYIWTRNDSAAAQP